MKKKMIYLVVLFLGLIFFLPFILNEVIFANNYLSKVSNDGWASFLGSYIGGVIGGIGTLVAMMSSLYQTQRQIEKTEEKDRNKERILEVDKVAKLVASYISSVVIYWDERTDSKYRIKKLKEENKYYEDLLNIWKICRNSRDFYNYRDYLLELESRDIKSDYVKRYFESKLTDDMDSNQATILYSEYEDEIEKIIIEKNRKISDINVQLNELKQKKIIGNNVFLLLEIKLRGMEYGDDLWKIIRKLHGELLDDVYIGNITDTVEEIKNYTKNFANEYIKH